MGTGPVTVTVELMEDAAGCPIAYTDATAVVVFVYQQPGGTYVIDIHARDDTAAGRVLVLLDGQPLPLPASAAAA